MSNLNKDAKDIFDELIQNNAYDNILQMYDNYTYHIELCMIPKDKMQEYETELSTNGPFSSSMKSFFNKNKIIIADTSGCPKFNITSAKMKTFTQSGDIRTTDKSNVHVNGRMTEANLTIQEVFGFTLMNKLDFMCSMLGYQSRHLTPMFLNIWFSGVENWGEWEKSNQNMRIEPYIGGIQYIYRGVITKVKTTTSTSAETIYEVTFASDNYSTDDKCFEACFSFSKTIDISTKTINFLGDVAIQLEKQINENYLLSQSTAVAKHIYDKGNHRPVIFKIFDIDGSLIYDGYNSYNSNSWFNTIQNTYDIEFAKRIASAYNREVQSQKDLIKQLKEKKDNNTNKTYYFPLVTYKNEYGKKDLSWNGSLGIPLFLDDSDEKNQKIIQSEIEEANRQKDKAQSSYEIERGIKKSVRKNKRAENEKIKSNMGTDYKSIYGVEQVQESSVDRINDAITTNITQNPFVKKEKIENSDDVVIKIYCDGSSLDNIFNNILISYIDIVSDESLGGIGACCNIVPHFLAEYEGKCYYNYDIEVSLVRVPGLKDFVIQQKKYLEQLKPNNEENPMDYSAMQYGFLKDIKDRKNPIKSYKYMYSGSDISVLEYNTDMSQLYYIDTGVSLYKYLLNNSMSISDQLSDGLSLTDNMVKKEKDLYNNKPESIKFLDEIKDVIHERTNGNIYMEDIWNGIMRKTGSKEDAERKDRNLEIAKYMLSQNFNAVGVGSNPITDINDSSTGLLSLKKIAWNNIFSVACQNATIKIIGDPFWIAPNIPFTSNIYQGMTAYSQTFPVLLFSYIPFVEQQDDDTFFVNEEYDYQIPYLVTEVNSLFENGQFTQELVCVLNPPFAQNTSLKTIGNNQQTKINGSVSVFFGNETKGREALIGENGEIYARDAYR